MKDKNSLVRDKKSHRQINKNPLKHMQINEENIPLKTISY